MPLPTVAFFEVYRGQVLDLLNQHSRLEVLEDGKGRVTVVGLREEPISSAEDILGFVRQAEELRAVGATSANEVSSRSHAILQVALYDAGDAARARGRLARRPRRLRARGGASSKDRQTRLEGAEINKSLLCLKECIRAMDNGSSHTPFRGSKLTQVLREAFTGRAKTAMIATVSPGSSAAEYTLNTLRYASRVKETSDRKRASPAPGQKEPAAPDGRAAEGPQAPLPPLVARRPNPAPIAPSAENARAAPRTRTVTVSLEGAADGAAAAPASAPAAAPASDSPRPATATPPPEADGAGLSRAASPAAEDGEAAAIEALGQSMHRDGALAMDDVVQEVRYLKAVAAVARTKEALVSGTAPSSSSRRSSSRRSAPSSRRWAPAAVARRRTRAPSTSTRRRWSRSSARSSAVLAAAGPPRRAEAAARRRGGTRREGQAARVARTR